MLGVDQATQSHLPSLKFDEANRYGNPREQNDLPVEVARREAQRAFQTAFAEPLQRPLGDGQLSFEPGSNTRCDIGVENAIEVLGDVADVRRRKDVV